MDRIYESMSLCISFLFSLSKNNMSLVLVLTILEVVQLNEFDDKAGLVNQFFTLEKKAHLVP